MWVFPSQTCQEFDEINASFALNGLSGRLFGMNRKGGYQISRSDSSVGIG